MSAPRLGRSRNIRVGNTAGVGVRVLPTAHYGGRLGRSRDIRVWGAGGGGGTPWDGYLYGGCICGSAGNSCTPPTYVLTTPLYSGGGQVQGSAGSGWPSYYIYNSLSILGTTPSVYVDVAYTLSIRVDGGSGTVPWEMASLVTTGTPAHTDSGFTGTVIASGTVAATGSATSVSGTVTVLVDGSGLIHLAIGMPNPSTFLPAIDPVGPVTAYVEWSLDSFTRH